MDVTGMPYHLGWWVNTQRNFHLKGRLGADRELRLQALPGWAWSAKAQQWEEGFSQLLQYVERHGHARVPYTYTVDGCKLGGWVVTQRQSYVEGTLDTDRQRRLQELPGWTWHPKADMWEEGFKSTPGLRQTPR